MSLNAHLNRGYSLILESPQWHKLGEVIKATGFQVIYTAGLRSHPSSCQTIAIHKIYGGR